MTFRFLFPAWWDKSGGYVRWICHAEIYIGQDHSLLVQMGGKDSPGFQLFFECSLSFGEDSNLAKYLFQTGWNQLSSQYLGMKSISGMATNLALMRKQPKRTVSHCKVMGLGEFHCDLTRPKSSKGSWHRRKSRNRTCFEILICLDQSPLFHKPSVRFACLDVVCLHGLQNIKSSFSWGQWVRLSRSSRAKATEGIVFDGELSGKPKDILGSGSR